MRLGTKILILTLTITLALSGTVVWVVTRDLTAHETSRAHADIDRAVSGYFSRIEALHERVHDFVTLVIEDPQNRSQLELLDSGDESTLEHFRLLFDDVVRVSLTRQGPGTTADVQASTRTSNGNPAPAFHVILNFEGRALLTFAPGDTRLADALRREPITWPYEPLLADEPALSRRYVWAAGGLYLALGIPLHIDVSAPATHAYFIGYRIDDRWAAALLGEAGPADAARLPGAAPPQVWFLVDGDVVARAGTIASGAMTTDAAATDDTLAAVTLAAGRSDVPRQVGFDAAGEHFVGKALTFGLPGARRGALVVASSLTGALAPLRRLQATIAWVTAGVILVAVVAFQFVSNLIARPVRQLVAGTQRVARGDFDEPIPVVRRDELGELARSFNDMAIGLQQRDLVKSTFGRFVDPRIVEGFLANPERLMPGGDKRVQTVLFSDLKSFTSISEQLDADDLVALLNGYLGDAADVVTGTRGIVDKFIGDAVVAFWGPPITAADEHAALACRAALRIVWGTRRHDERCRQLGVPSLGVRVGIATGEVLVGLIGSSNKYDYTVMGDTANLGSRLEGLNKLYGTSILVTARTAREAGDAVVTRRIDAVRVVGRAEPVEVFEVVADRDEPNAEIAMATARRCEAFAKAAGRYARREWAAAATAFERVCREWPEDSAARTFAERCAAFQHQDPGPGWDGVWAATSK